MIKRIKPNGVVVRWLYPLCKLSVADAASEIINASPSRRTAYVFAARKCLSGNYWWVAHLTAEMVADIYGLTDIQRRGGAR